MVKAADLGYASENLQDIPNKQEKKSRDLDRALANLTSVTPPDRLSTLPLPSSLFGKE